jgi:hypothetical protein
VVVVVVLAATDLKAQMLGVASPFIGLTRRRHGQGSAVAVVAQLVTVVVSLLTVSVVAQVETR